MSDTAYFSPSRLSFYPENMVIDGTFSVEKGNLPEDVVLLNEEQAAAYWKVTPPDGKVLGQVDGLPAWVDAAPVPDDVLYEQELNEINSAYDKDVSDLVLKYSRIGLFDGETEAAKKAELYSQLQERKSAYADDLDALDIKYGG